MATINCFEDLDIWKNARELCTTIYNLINKNDSFSHNYALKDQLIRSSGSIMDNIAEGFGREGNREFINFLSIAQGSFNEVKSQIYRAYDFGYISEQDKTKLFADIDNIRYGIKAFINYLLKSTYKGNKFKTR